MRIPITAAGTSWHIERVLASLWPWVKGAQRCSLGPAGVYKSAVTGGGESMKAYHLYIC